MLTAKGGEREAVVEGAGKTDRGPARELPPRPSPCSHGPCCGPGAALLGVAGTCLAQLRCPCPAQVSQPQGLPLTTLCIPTRGGEEECSPAGESRELRSQGNLVASGMTGEDPSLRVMDRETRLGSWPSTHSLPAWTPQRLPLQSSSDPWMPFHWRGLHHAPAPSLALPPLSGNSPPAFLHMEDGRCTHRHVLCAIPWGVCVRPRRPRLPQIYQHVTVEADSALRAGAGGAASFRVGLRNPALALFHQKGVPLCWTSHHFCSDTGVGCSVGSVSQERRFVREERKSHLQTEVVQAAARRHPLIQRCSQVPGPRWFMKQPSPRGKTRLRKRGFLGKLNSNGTQQPCSQTADSETPRGRCDGGLHAITV